MLITEYPVGNYILPSVFIVNTTPHSARNLSNNAGIGARFLSIGYADISALALIGLLIQRGYLTSLFSF